jgi:hypothetical protein
VVNAPPDRDHRGGHGHVEDHRTAGLPVGARCARRSVRLQRLALHLHECGARLAFEALIAVADGHDLDDVLEDFGSVPIHVYRQIGASELEIDAPVLIHGSRDDEA